MSRKSCPVDVVPNARKPREQSGIDEYDFTYIWSDSQTVEEATERMSKMAGHELNKKSVVARAARYRRNGVNLKNMRPKMAAA